MPEAHAVPEAAATLGRLAVDDVVDVALELLEHLVALGVGQHLVGDGLVELGLRLVDDGALEAVDVLALRLGDVCERLARLELPVELLLGEAEVLRRRVAAGAAVEEHAASAGTAGAVTLAALQRAAERDAPVGLDPRLDAIGLRLGEAPVLDRLVEAVLERALQRGAEVVRADVQPLGGVVEQRLALLRG